MTGGGRTNAWDSQNRLVSCIINGNTTAYKYGADGLRRQSAKNGISTDYAYDGQNMIREGHATGGTLTPSTVTATYLVGARGPECRVDETQPTEGYYFGGTPTTPAPVRGRGLTKWYVFDGLGSVVGEVDASGNLTSSPKYDVYGAVRGNGGTATSKQGFVGSLGHVSDDTGLVYMRARYYDPNTGRFVSEDPALNGTNWFVYAGANPVNCVDSTGKANVWLESGAAIMGLACLTAALLSPIPVAIDYAIKACAWFGAAIVFGATDKMPLAIGEIAGMIAITQAYVKDIALMIVSTKLAQNFGIAQLDVVMVAACAEGFTLLGEMAYQDAGF